MKASELLFYNQDDTCGCAFGGLSGVDRGSAVTGRQ